MEVECGRHGECSFEWIGLLLTGTDVYKSCGVVTFTTIFVKYYDHIPSIQMKTILNHFLA